MYGQVFRQLGEKEYCVCCHKKKHILKCKLSVVVVNSATQGQ